MLKEKLSPFIRDNTSAMIAGEVGKDMFLIADYPQSEQD